MTGPEHAFETGSTVPVPENAAPDSPRRNRPRFDDLPVPDDTANLREGPDLHPLCIGLLPLIGVWRGAGEMVAPGTDTPFAFGQQVVFAHDGESFVSYESRTWLLDDDGAVTGPGPRETGFWRPQADGTLEVLIAHSTGLVTPFYGRSRNLTSWEMETWALVRTETAPTVERSTRLYGVVRGDLAYVDEREHVEHGMAPFASAQLGRIAG
ncbi:FABP family protein [Pseudonocardia charpentierae]|uniref:Ferric nitrobindin-like protein n=1 Tax=Pseudonocardia charpentierae TaxID=3075545 RepID=A0ABU2N9W9_9PSEU|nr:FABP family protein [Pseudonocardia sp. DSM 45834]MDT0350745.1 FABP family protein [Pseudonocardia sp. DSM 45834]